MGETFACRNYEQSVVIASISKEFGVTKETATQIFEELNGRRLFSVKEEPASSGQGFSFSFIVSKYSICVEKCLVGLLAMCWGFVKKDSVSAFLQIPTIAQSIRKLTDSEICLYNTIKALCKEKNVKLMDRQTIISFIISNNTGAIFANEQDVDFVIQSLCQKDLLELSGNQVKIK